MENKDFIDISKGSQNIFKKFRNKLIQVEQKYTKEHKPYCARMAKKEFEKILNDRLRQIGKRQDEVTEEMLKLPKFDFEQYGNIKDFELQSTQDAVEQIKVGITTQTKKVGEYKNYVHKPSGSGTAVFIPIEKLTKKNTNGSDSPPVDPLTSD